MQAGKSAGTEASVNQVGKGRPLALTSGNALGRGPALPVSGTSTDTGGMTSCGATLRDEWVQPVCPWSQQTAPPEGP